jgi:hypothetical protein
MVNWWGGATDWPRWKSNQDAASGACSEDRACGQHWRRDYAGLGQIDALGPVSLKAERASVGRQAETEAAPIRYVAELVGDTYCERAIRWVIALTVPCCDPLTIALTGGSVRSMETRLNDVRHLLDRASAEGE